MAQYSKGITLRSVPEEEAALKKAPGKDPVSIFRKNLRGALIPTEDEQPVPQDDLFPMHWSQFATDSYKYSGLLGSAANLAGLPLRAAGHAARSMGLPVDDVVSSPENLTALLRIVSNPADNIDRLMGIEPDPSGSFLPRGHMPTEHSSQRHSFRHRKHGNLFFEAATAPLAVKEATADSLVARAQFLQEFKERFRQEAEAVLEKEAAPKKEESRPRYNFHTREAPGFFMQHPIASVLGGAGALGAGFLMHKMHADDDLEDAQHMAFHHAMHLFPELKTEDPKKMRLLWASARQVAPHMSKNPLLLGSWMKGLAKGYSGAHIAPQDLKTLQDLEHGVQGRPEDQKGLMGHLSDVASIGGNLSKIMQLARPPKS